ncbi:MAG: hypothetical protein IM559_15740 [Pseudanabaena sp. M151S2SP2A07QC]|jgi:hypothetical protein|nr:hypothetical protein [Pseudanabaena sp. M151S2SP2A07QC]
MVEQRLADLRTAVSTVKEFSEFFKLSEALRSRGFEFIFDESILSLEKQGYGFEMYSANLDFISASTHFFAITSYSLNDLYTTHWAELFSRQEFYSAMVLRAIEKVYQTQRPVYQVTPGHLVTETFSPLKRQVVVEIAAVAPFWLSKESNKIDGFIAVTKLLETDDQKPTEQ